MTDSPLHSGQAHSVSDSASTSSTHERIDQTAKANPEELRNAALRLALVPGIGPRSYKHLLEHFETPQRVLSAAPSELLKVPGVGTKIANAIAFANERIAIEPQLKICEENEISVVVNGGENYPERLAEIYDPPNVLFAQGEIRKEDAVAIAIVGTRHATRYGLQTADRLASGLAMAGFTIVSGLARGIDAAAHRGALNAGGRTIAVLGSGLLNLYPPEHKDLAHEITKQGAVVSEYLPAQAPKSGAFPQRNRIVTGLSLGVIVIEAAERSGALISARLAEEQGREVFAVPGRIDSRSSRGCHGLIQDGAKLVGSIDDILDELGPLAKPASGGVDSEGNAKVIHHPAELKLTEQESLILQHVESDPTPIDFVIEKCGLPTSRVLSTISVLEIRRLVRRVAGNKLVRI